MKARECLCESTTGYANNVGGYDYHCDSCGRLKSRTATHYASQRREAFADAVVVSEKPVGCVRCIGG